MNHLRAHLSKNTPWFLVPEVLECTWSFKADLYRLTPNFTIFVPFYKFALR